MRIKNGFELRSVCGETFVVAYGIENINFDKVVSLNATAAYLWRAVEGSDFTAQTLAELLCQEYEVEAGQAASDAKALLDEWVKIGVVEA